MSPIITLLLRTKATLVIPDVNRTRVRKSYALRHYMFSLVFVSRRALPDGQGRREASSGVV